MGETKWNKKENMTNMKSKVKKRKEQFKNMRGFIQLPPLVDVKEGFTDEDASGNDASGNDASGNDASGNLFTDVNNTMNEFIESNEEMFDDIDEATSEDNLADKQWREKLKEAKLSDELLYILQNLKAWTEIDETKSNSNDEFCDQPASTEVEEEFSTSLKHVRVVMKNIALILTNLPKLILLSFDFIDYLIKKLVANYCEVMAIFSGNSPKIPDSVMNVVFEQVDKLLYVFIVFIVSYNWFFILFYYDRTELSDNVEYEYLSSSYFINNEYIKPMMSQEPGSVADWIMKHVFSSVIYVISFFAYICTEHSVKTSFTIPNLMQRIISLNKMFPSLGTDLLDSIPVKWIFTIVLAYFGIPSLMKMMKYLVHMSPSMDPLTSSSAKGLYMLVLVVAGMGFLAWPVGDSMYWILKEYMSPIVESKKDKDHANSEHMYTKIAEKVMDKFKNITDEYVSESSVTPMIKAVLITIVTLFVRVLSLIVLLPYTNAIIFMMLSAFSLGALFMFGRTFLTNISKVNESITKTLKACLTYRQIVSKMASSFNKILLSVLILITCISSVMAYNSQWPADSDSTFLKTILLTHLYVVITFISLHLTNILTYDTLIKYVTQPFM